MDDLEKYLNERIEKDKEFKRIWEDLQQKNRTSICVREYGALWGQANSYSPLPRPGHRENELQILKNKSTSPLKFSMYHLETLYIPSHSFDRPTGPV